MRKHAVLTALGILAVPTLAQQGVWEDWFHWGNDQLSGSDRTRAVHLVHVWDGQTPKMLSISYGATDVHNRLWTPPVGGAWGAAGSFTDIPIPASYPQTKLFCGGHAAMADGRILWGRR
jgi:hypothetical protein